MGNRTRFEELVMAKALEFKVGTLNGDLLDMMSQSGDLPEGLLKNVCAKVSVEMSDKLDQVCSLLSISKRRFIESALSDALQKAESIMHDDVDMLEHVNNLPLVSRPDMEV